MLSNYYTLASIVSSLDSTLRGTSIREAFSQERDELVVTFEMLPAALVISCRADTATLYLHPAFARARRNSAAVLKQVWSRTIRSVAIHPADRELIFELDSNLRLIAQLFGSKSNVLLVGNDGLILDSFRDAKRLKATPYRQTRQERIFDLTTWRAMLDQAPEATVALVTRKAFPSFGKLVVTELLYRAGIPTTTLCAGVGQRDRASIEKEIRLVLDELQSPQARVYEARGRPSDPVFSIIRLTHRSGNAERTFENIHEAVRYCLSRSRRAHTFVTEAGRITSTLEKEQEKALRKLGAVDDDLQKHDRAAEYEMFGRLLMANPASVRGMESIVLQSDSGPVTIPLDRTLTIIRNAQHYFEKAKRSRLARVQALGRREELKRRTMVAEQLLASIGEIETTEELRGFTHDHSEDLNLFGLGTKEQKKNDLPFRVFTVDGGFQVLAGKSSANNDLLTMKHAKPHDLWFHARGSSGSHVVLKVDSGAGKPGKKAREQAAAIAAYYSKMKGARIVPVAMTERKYVRKPRGASAGTVVLERESVIFAEPGLPGGSS